MKRRRREGWGGKRRIIRSFEESSTQTHNKGAMRQTQRDEASRSHGVLKRTSLVCEARRSTERLLTLRVHSLAIDSYLGLSVLYRFAISGTSLQVNA